MVFDDLLQRDLIKQFTNHDKIKNLLDQQSISFYIGFDPTASSLHIGHLLQIVTAKRLKDAGHQPIVLIGGATASIGDPTGKKTIRQTLSLNQTALNSISISNQIINILGREINIVNNMDWFYDMNYLKFISEIGKHFSVNSMLRADCFKSRMENGLSFLEFNYMLMQAFDFLSLNEQYDCILQIGGDDQWSNILSGVDLIRRKGRESFGLTISLLTNSVGQKMGKTEKGTVWLDSNKTSVFDFFQFWRNIQDTEIKKCFKLLTFLSLEEINNIPFSNASEINESKKRLAFELTKMVHNEENAFTCLKQAEFLFESKDIINIELLTVDNNIKIIDLLVDCKFATSKTDAKKLIKNKGIYINKIAIDNYSMIIDKNTFGNTFMLGRGKKKCCQIIIK